MQHPLRNFCVFGRSTWNNGCFKHFNSRRKQATTFPRCLGTSRPEDVVIVSAARTPMGSFGGALQRLTATDLGSLAIREAVKRSGISGSDIGDCYMGLVLAAGAQQTPARQALLKAGLPETVESTTINKACASGMKSVMIAAQTILLGQEKVVLAGGMESMSNAHFTLPRRSLEWKEQKLLDSIVHDGVLDPGLGIIMGDCCENNNKKMGITRQEQDDFCVESYKRSAHAWSSGIMASEVFTVDVQTKHVPVQLAEDEEFRNLQEDKIASLKPAFQKDGTITAANSSKMNDGACALVLTSSEEAERRGIKPLAKIITYADAATHPIDFPIAPSMAAEKVLKQSDISKDDVTMWEINEAFSGVVIATMRLLNIDHSKVNIHGGAVSLGHAVGSSGARLCAHLAHNLKAGEVGVASICNGGGAASAIMIQGM